MKRTLKNALYLGLLCGISYFAVYYVKKVLGVVTPQMIRDGFSEEYIGKVSSVYFITYAVGQLVNGMIGDKVKAKYMIGLGLILAGIANILFPAMLDLSENAAIAAYGMVGFFLSMIYGPMTKVVSENVESLYVPRCSLGYTFASYISSPAVGVAAAVVSWRALFTTSSILLIVMGLMCFLFFTLFEKKGVVKYNQYTPKNKQTNGISVLFKHNIVKFTIISILTGIIRTTVVFWMPTYINQYLGFSEEQSALLYTVCTFIISSSAFISVFTYERLKKNINSTLILMFAFSAAAFLLLYIIKSTYINIALLTIAVTASCGAATMLWSVYCPSLKSTGMISSATGFLDFISYIAAAVSSTLFANAVSQIGWQNLILVWFLLMLIGVLISLPYSKLHTHRLKNQSTSID